jgi:lipopolysaccharide/colanic/teichoic acid biosynthesis glycosyltransferase
MNCPPLKPGILSPADMFDNATSDTAKNNRLNVLYARNYSVLTDAEILIKGWKNLGRYKNLYPKKKTHSKKVRIFVQNMEQ